MTYYHWAPILLKEGSIIEPGNFARIVFGAQLNSWQPDKALREYILEIFRRKHYPDKPSRNECCFVFETQEAANLAIQYNALFINSILYEVVPINENCLSHTGDFSFAISGDVPMQKALYDLAHKYWTSQLMSTHSHMEKILQSPVKIIRKMNNGTELGFLQRNNYNVSPILSAHRGDAVADIFSLL